MSEVVVRLRPDVYEQLQKRAAAQERELTDVIAEAVEHWLEEDVEARIQRALERRGMLAQPPRRPRDQEVLEQDRQRVRQILAKLSPPLSEDIIQERELTDVIAEAVEHWLEEDVEARIQRALERRGMLARPEERRYATGRPINRRELERRLANLRLIPPLSEDIIAERGER